MTGSFAFAQVTVDPECLKNATIYTTQKACTTATSAACYEDNNGSWVSGKCVSMSEPEWKALGFTTYWFVF